MICRPFDEVGEARRSFGHVRTRSLHRVHLKWHYVGNNFLTMLSNMVMNINLSDMWTYRKALQRNMGLGLDLKEDRFGFEQEISIKIAFGGLPCI